MTFGIDDMALYVPKLYLDIRTLAEKRDIAYEKLSKGLGLHKMAVCDAHEDAATMAAEAIFELIDRNQLNPHQIGRIYLGTESALDGSKPTATYAIEMVQQKLRKNWGDDCFRHCDVVDMTFACIGAVDAFHNTMDWVVANPEGIAIVVASDIAKYELNSTGEYTQGAGAVAMLIKAQPRLMAFNRIYGIATESVHDFYKPRRETYVETPVFDGQYSNQCYQQRMAEALAHFRVNAEKAKLIKPGQFPALSERWARMIFHLPYAFHAKRIYVEQFIEERKQKGVWEADMQKYGFPNLAVIRFADQLAYQKAYNGFLKSVSDSSIYKAFIQNKLEKAHRASQETGNLYTASIFLALMSCLELDHHEKAKLDGKRFGFIAYGSGSKAKVFEGIIQKGWQDVVQKFDVFKKLENRIELDYKVYENLHNQCQKVAYHQESGRWGLQKIGSEGVTLGARYYYELT
ncbi:MAG: hydroxymethylglutaryl-CoA synthase family protein [Saprospiraceae bacterium]|nr:hydroxymethylglutaryl-CoA synthase family protein [Saprospiraceae bacterium]